MKTKLQALISEQKTLTARFEELLKETTSKPYAFIGNSEHWENIREYLDPKGDDNLYRFKDKASLYLNIDDVIICDNATDKFRLLVSQTHTIIDLNEQPDFFDKLNSPDPKRVYIKGHRTRGTEVIKMLEDLGGVNKRQFIGLDSDSGYYITKKGFIDNAPICNLSDYTELYLPDLEPPKEEVELIEGEVYENEDGCVWIHDHLDVSDSSSISICGLDNKGNLHLQGWFSLAGLKKSTNTELLFDIIKDNNKHFDKENMRLLDVEEWSGKAGEAFIYVSSKGFWEAVIFDDKSNYNNAPFYFIPYNDQTKHLIGTTDIPDKHYKFVRNDN